MGKRLGFVAIALIVVAAVSLLYIAIHMKIPSNTYTEPPAYNASNGIETEKECGICFCFETGIEWAFDSAFFLDKRHGWGIAGGGLWQTTDGGHNWALLRAAEKKFETGVHMTGVESADGFLKKVQFLNETDGWLLEGSALLETKDNCKKWNRHKFEHIIVRDFIFFDLSHGWFVGEKVRYPRSEDEVEGWEGVMYSTTDGGENWNDITSKELSADEPLLTIWPLSWDELWVVGSHTILHSKNGGKHWKSLDADRRYNIGGALFNVNIQSNGFGWILSNWLDQFLLTSNNGRTWEVREVPPEIGQYIDFIRIGSSEMWMLGKGIFKSEDSGKTWNKINDGCFYTIVYIKETNELLFLGKTAARCVLKQESRLKLNGS